MNDRRLAVETFRDECVWARSIRVHFAELFESGHGRSALLGEVANTFFHDLNLLLVEYILLQQCKLTDPASSGVGKTNLTTNYLLTMDWAPATRLELERLNQQLLAYRAKVVDARRKLIAHLDLKTKLQTVGLGEVAESDEAAFWEHLQAFVNAAHDEAVGGPYEILCAMPDGDVLSLVHRLADAVDYDDLMKESPDLLVARSEKRRYGNI